MNILKNKKCNIKINDEEIETFTRWQDPTIKEQQQELERYKNIIDELEKWLKDKSKGRPEYTNYDGVLNKLKELKGE